MRRGLLLSLSVSAVYTLLFIGSCGIYTTTLPLNPPYGLSMGTDILTFSVNNTEPYFTGPELADIVGYTVWFKEEQGGYYSFCAYKQAIPTPTIPRRVLDEGDTNYVDFVDLDPLGGPPFKITVSVRDLYFQYMWAKSLYELYQDDPERRFFFAVSTQGADDEESERVEFGRWPD